MPDDFDDLEGTSDSTSSAAACITVTAEQVVVFWDRFCNLSLKIH